MNQQRHLARFAYLSLSPAVLLFAGFLFFPIVFVFYMSLQDWGLIGAPHFVGLENYVNLFQDDLFWVSLRNTLIYSLSVPVKVALALILAIMLNQKVKGLKLFRMAYFLPVVLSLVVVALVWEWMFNANYGFVNYLLSSMGWPRQHWLTDPHYAMLVLIVVSIWKGLGYNLVIFLAGLQGIPRDVYEAAAIDGTSAVQRFWYITVPLIKPTTWFVFLITLIGDFKVFDLAYVMTGGGPGNSTTVFVQYIYNMAFQNFHMGYAAAASVVFFAILFVFSMVQMMWFREV